MECCKQPIHRHSGGRGILSLLPMWMCSECGYIFRRGENHLLTCPKCDGKRKQPSKAVMENARAAIENKILAYFCQKAGIVYEPKDTHEERRDFAHHVLSPNLSPYEQESLFQFFTEYFNDGFEDGDFSQYDSTGGTPAVVTSPKHHGSYAAEFDASGDYCLKDTSALTTLYLRVYWRFDALPPSNSDYCYIYRIYKYGAGTPAVIFMVYKTSDTIYLRHYGENGFPSTNHAFSFSVDTWYCVECKLVVNTASNGELRFWIDESEICTHTGLDTSGLTSVGRIVLGTQVSTYTVTTNIDCVVVADAYIGQETVPIDVTDSGSGVDVLANFDRIFPETGGGTDTPAIEGQIQVYDYGAFKIRVSDSGVGVDSTFEGRDVEELGYGVEAVSIEVQNPVSDVGGGVDSVKFVGQVGEAVIIEASIPAAEVGAGVETLLNMQGSCIFGDSGLGVDVPSKVVWNNPEISDSGVGAESINIDEMKNVDIQDGGSGTDLLTQFERNFPDAGIGNDVLKEFDRQFAEVGSGIEILKELDRSFKETGIGTDTYLGSKEEIITESGIGEDLPSIQGQPTILDNGLGEDLFTSLQSQILVLDTGLGADVPIIEGEEGGQVVFNLIGQQSNFSLEGEKEAFELVGEKGEFELEW